MKIRVALLEVVILSVFHKHSICFFFHHYAFIKPIKMNTCGFAGVYSNTKVQFGTIRRRQPLIPVYFSQATFDLCF